MPEKNIIEFQAQTTQKEDVSLSHTVPNLTLESLPAIFIRSNQLPWDNCMDS